MYRLLRHYRLSIHNLQLTTVQNNLQQRSEICSFCNFYHLKPVRHFNTSYGRPQTTYSSTALEETSTQKQRRKSRKYVELLEVSDEHTMNTSATIKNLNANNISQLANQPEISLDQVHKIKKNRTLTTRQTPVNPMPANFQETELQYDSTEVDVHPSSSSVQLQEILDDEDHVPGISTESVLYKNAALLNSIPDCNENIMDETSYESSPLVANEHLTQKKKITKHTSRSAEGKLMIQMQQNELKRLGKQESLKHCLLSYLDVCVNCGMTSYGLATLNYYRKRGKNFHEQPHVMDVAIHNMLLHGFARSGNLAKIKDVLDIIKEDSIKPNPQTYAAVFECIGRLKQPHNNSSDYPFDTSEFLKRINSEMRAENITLNDVLSKSKFTGNQREMTNCGILILNPDFVPSYTSPSVSYENHLLENLSRTERQVVKPADGLFTVEELLQRADRQIELESQGQIAVRSIAITKEPTEAVFKLREKVTQYEETWRKVIEDAFERDLTTLKFKNKTDRSRLKINIYPYLRILEKHHYVDIILREIRRLATGSEAFSPSLGNLSRQLGQSVYHRYQVEMKKRHGIHDKVSKIHKQYCKAYLNGETGLNNRTVWQKLLHESRHIGPTTDIKIACWPTNLAGGIGAFLYNIILRDIKIDWNRLTSTGASEMYLPAFYAVFRTHRHLIMQEIKPHPLITRMYKDAELETIDFDSSLLPSLTPPVPWYSIDNGGYLISDSNLIRMHFQTGQQRQRLEDAPEQQIYPVLDSLNQLGSIPWKINESVLEIALSVFRNGGSKKLDIPEPPSSHIPPPILDMSLSKEDRNSIAKQRLKEKRLKADMYSMWCDVLYRLSLANHYRNEVFWLPHNMDFRGRAYPIPPHVNHLGSDLARSLMVFALGKPLGPMGLDWLKIHIINLTGIKKRESNDERLRYANEILPKILDSARNPLTGEMWWQESEEPWQTLAACMEIEEALKLPNPDDYVSRFPVHQDGSCNGLQHYAALGRDQSGAESVNLVPSAKPQDVYTTIAALVEKEREKDAANGMMIAIQLKGIIKRKVIKQTVMTTVYGVTRFGARLQIAKQLKDVGFPDEILWQGSHYLAHKTFTSLREMFTSAKLIQDWLTDCARFIAFLRGEHVEWVTPLGLPVVQPYNKNIQVFDGKKPTQNYHADMFQRPNVMKQKNAFPPNFIHSLDSCHMMLTSLYCEHAGLTFVSVHDCFWTHAASVPVMNKICREQFVALHSEPILENLSEFLLKKFCFPDSEVLSDGSIAELTKYKMNEALMRVPTRGSFELKNVLDSVYFFS